MSGSRLRPYVGPIIASLVVLALGAGAVYAAIPNNGTYYACLTKSTGAIRVINYPKVKCAKGQTLIKWSQQGPAGPQGPQGAQGPAGPADWNAIPNRPAGFADGVDNTGVTGVKLTTVTSSSVGVGPDGWQNVAASCPVGSKVTGGGAYSSSRWLHTTDSYPSGGTNWTVWAHNTDSTLHNLTAYAVCMSVEPSGAISAANKGVKPAKLRKHK